MANGKITKDAVDKLQKTSSPVFLWDTIKPGFGVKVTPAGKKVFILQYRMGGRGSATRRYTIGPYGTWTVDGAAREAGRLLLLVGQGVDPAAERQDSRNEAIDLAFNRIADLYLEEYVKSETPRSYKFVESALRLHVRPSLKDKALTDIHDTHIANVISKIPATSRALRRNVYSVMSGLFRWAKVDARLIKFNPVADMKAPSSAASRDRVLNDDEIKIVWRGMGGLSYPFGPWAQLLLVLGQRRTEVGAMEWKDLNRSERQWLIPGAKTKNGKQHLVPLSDYARKLLDDLAGGKTWPKRGLVFTTNRKTPISGFSKAKTRIDTEIANLIKAEAMALDVEPHDMEHWRYHDLRRTMATTMQRLRIAPAVIEACENRLAGESKKGSAKVYQLYDYIDEKRSAMQKWGEHLRLILSDRGDNVVPLALKVS